VSPALALAVAVWAHVGGIPTRAEFTAPVTLGDEADASYTVAWTDGDEDPTGLFTFFYQPKNAPPPARDKGPATDGTVIEGGIEVEILSADNDLVWDTSAVPAGSYFVYSITEDPPFSGLLSVSPGVVTVRHPGDPLYPAVAVVEPDGEADVVPATYTIRWHARGEGPLVATVVVHPFGAAPDAGPDGALVVAADVAMTAAGDGTFEGALAWDVSAVAQGAYYADVTVRDGGGREHAAFSLGALTVDHGATPPADGGVVGGSDGGGPGATDAGTGGGGGGGGCACRAGGRSGGGDPVALAGALALLAAVAAVCRRRAGHSSRNASSAPRSSSDSDSSENGGMSPPTPKNRPWRTFSITTSDGATPGKSSG
jgi:hypothetical protein